MPRPSRDYVQIAIRVPREWQDEADEVAAILSRPGLEASRTDAFRAAIARGFEVLRAEATKNEKARGRSPRLSTPAPARGPK